MAAAPVGAVHGRSWILPDMTASITGAAPGVLEKCSALVVVSHEHFAAAVSLAESHVLDACCRAAHATSSTASQGAAATAVVVTPAKVLTSRWRWDWSV